ncbi:MAG: DNA-binding response regulator [Chloroflexi bacterium]|nr:MAG: DNA-binding response regulator [Chloroflexota bacterium]
MDERSRKSWAKPSGQAHILVVDDEPAARLSLAELLSLEGYEVTPAAGGEEVVTLLTEKGQRFDLAVVDLKMPGMDGLQVVEALRQYSPDTVVIMLTAHGTLETAVQAMRQGAHDYLLKPANVNEILSSVAAGLEKYRRMQRRRELLSLMERTLSALATVERGHALKEEEAMEIAAEAERFLQSRDILVDRQKHLVTRQGKPIDLTPTEFDLLVTLMSRPDQVMTPQELVQAVQGYEADVWEARSIIRVHIRRLRQKLEPDPAHPSYIVTVRGAGYMFSSSP